MPPSAASNHPALAERAPVNAAFSCPKSSLSNSDGVRAPQLTATNGAAARALRSCRYRATSSLPVPVSPVMRTVASVGATCSSRVSSSRERGSSKTSARARYDGASNRGNRRRGRMASWRGKVVLRWTLVHQKGPERTPLRNWVREATALPRPPPARRRSRRAKRRSGRTARQWLDEAAARDPYGDGAFEVRKAREAIVAAVRRLAALGQPSTGGSAVRPMSRSTDDREPLSRTVGHHRVRSSSATVRGRGAAASRLTRAPGQHRRQGQDNRAAVAELERDGQLVTRSRAGSRRLASVISAVAAAEPRADFGFPRRRRSYEDRELPLLALGPERHELEKRRPDPREQRDQLVIEIRTKLRGGDHVTPSRSRGSSPAGPKSQRVRKSSMGCTSGAQAWDGSCGAPPSSRCTSRRGCLHGSR